MNKVKAAMLGGLRRMLIVGLLLCASLLGSASVAHAVPSCTPQVWFNGIGTQVCL